MCGASEEALLSFLRVRARPPHPTIARLKSARISFAHEKRMDMTADIALLAADGLEVRVDYISRNDVQIPLSPWVGLDSPTWDARLTS